MTEEAHVGDFMDHSDAATDLDRIYCPLSSGQIRVLHLSPGIRGDELSGKLVTDHLDDEAIEYDALSYIWGDPSPSDTIWLAGEAVPITDNLATALQNLRYHDATLKIWIDALCIDQRNEIERAHQVQLMKRLYTSAKIVRIWINEPTIDPNYKAVKVLHDFYKVPDDKEARSLNMGHDAKFWDPIAPIFTNDYWSRAWIQQEVFNATHLLLHCLKIVIPGMSIARFQMAVLEKYGRSLQSKTITDVPWIEQLGPMADLEAPAARAILFYQNKDKDKIKLFNLCEMLTLNVHATRLQDRVYALMHLADDYEDGGIVIDYAKSGLDVLIDAANYHVRKHCDLRFLGSSSMEIMDVRVLRRHQFPTWIPSAWLGEENRGSSLGDTFEISTRTRCLPHSVMISERRLRIRGIKIDNVRRCLFHGVAREEMTP